MLHSTNKHNAYGVVETPIAAVHRGLVAVIDALAAGDTQRVVLDPDVEIRLAHTCTARARARRIRLSRRP